jgi:hypothetical protein
MHNNAMVNDKERVMAVMVIEDANANKGGVTKRVYSDLIDLHNETLATAILHASGMLTNVGNIADVLRDFKTCGEPLHNIDGTVACWHDAVQTNSHFTFILL